MPPFATATTFFASHDVPRNILKGGADFCYTAHLETSRVVPTITECILAYKKKIGGNHAF